MMCRIIAIILLLTLEGYSVDICNDFTCDSLAVDKIMQANGVAWNGHWSIERDSAGRIISLYLDNEHGPQAIVLPPEIGALSKLKRLYCDYGSLEALPQEIGLLTDLEYLYLNDNKLSNLPNTICQLKKLSYLFLQRNNLAGLPDSMTSLTNLSKQGGLSVYGNQLCNLSTGLAQWLDQFDSSWQTSQNCQSAISARSKNGYSLRNDRLPAYGHVSLLGRTIKSEEYASLLKKNNLLRLYYISKYSKRKD